MEKNENLRHVFLIGCKGIPARYGGFETFVDQLTEYRTAGNIRYHVACAAEPAEYDRKHAVFSCHGAHCVTFCWRRLGSARAVAYDLDALGWFIRYAEQERIPHPVFYILACRIGPFIGHYEKKIRALGGELYVNPDGHEFLRARWSRPVRRYWKFSERLMVKHAGLVICDSRAIERYIQKEYRKYTPRTTFIAYGAQTEPSALADDAEELLAWYGERGVRPGEYYLVVGRFVPENNYETMIREFLKSGTKRKFVLITQVSDEFLGELREKTGFDRDDRICFAGTVYDQQLLKKIRENAYGYLHGHEVGGTNPSLLEALASTRLCLLLDVGFNREAAGDGALYWTKEPGSLAGLIDAADALTDEKRSELGSRARARIEKEYSWEHITEQYEHLFLYHQAE